MLEELAAMQSSEEDVWMNKLSFEVETRSSDGEELIHKTYTFTHAKEWDKWTFHEYEEKRTADVDRITDRDWRRERHVIWNDSESRDVSVPPEVTAELSERLGVDVTLQQP